MELDAETKLGSQKLNVTMSNEKADEDTEIAVTPKDPWYCQVVDEALPT